jgi:hypothetical protein
MCATGTCDDCLRNVAILSGLPGEDGIDGNRIQIGTGAPDNADFSDDDFYIDRNSPLNFYHKEAGVWVFLGRLQGIDGNGFYLSETTLVSSAALLASDATPPIITQVPPTGYAIIPVSITGSLRFNSIAYQATQGLSVRYNDNANTFVGNWSAAFIQNTNSGVGTCAISPPLFAIPGVALNIKPSIGGVITTGNSPLLVRVIYYITPL